MHSPMPAFMICATCTTTLLVTGVPVHIVAARVGHADPAVTLRIYSHVLREHPSASAMSSPRPSRHLLAMR